MRGSLRGSVRVRVSEVFRGFERFSEVFQRPSQSPSQSAIFLSKLRVVLPLLVLPLKTPTTIEEILVRSPYACFECCSGKISRPARLDSARATRSG